MKSTVLTAIVIIQSQISNMQRKEWIHQFSLRDTGGHLGVLRAVVTQLCELLRVGLVTKVLALS